MVCWVSRVTLRVAAGQMPRIRISEPGRLAAGRLCDPAVENGPAVASRGSGGPAAPALGPLAVADDPRLMDLLAGQAEVLGRR
jgi:hypothetical protein